MPARCPHGFLAALCVVETCQHWDGLHFDIDSRYKPGAAAARRAKKRERDRERHRERAAERRARA